MRLGITVRSRDGRGIFEDDELFSEDEEILERVKIDSFVSAEIHNEDFNSDGNGDSERRRECSESCFKKARHENSRQESVNVKETSTVTSSSGRMSSS